MMCLGGWKRRKQTCEFELLMPRIYTQASSFYQNDSHILWFSHKRSGRNTEREHRSLQAQLHWFKRRKKLTHTSLFGKCSANHSETLPVAAYFVSQRVHLVTLVP